MNRLPFTLPLVAALACCLGCQEATAPVAETSRVASSPAAPSPTAGTPVTQPLAAPPGETGALPAAPSNDAPPAASLRTRDITFDTIKFPMEKDQKFERSMLTPAIEKMNGTPVKIRGWIHPNSVFQQSGITQFVLVRDNQECCFGPGAAIYDCIMVEMKPGNTADFTTRPIAVSGTCSIRELTAPWGALLAIYHLQADAAK